MPQPGEAVYNHDPTMRAIDSAWRLRGKCVTDDKHVQNTATSPNVTARQARHFAGTYCEGCPVREQCLDWAQSEPDFLGIAGGHTFRERAKTRVVTPIDIWAEDHTRSAINLSKPAATRRQHTVALDGQHFDGRMWTAICGASVHPTRTIADERLAMTAVRCPWCSRKAA
ncbi:WhiB family transcriptional regulator [Streptomyces sp. 796.1]|uniref:WhiB family transcriptional regulator n=1 Tax=Streptomyces sp. 796.1 TaxID=3163029 RepID=UPI0039C9F550